MDDNRYQYDEVAVGAQDSQNDTINKLALKTLQNDGRLKPEACLRRFKNLIVKNNVSNPAYQVDIIADYLVLESSDSALRYLSSISETVSIAVSGAGGLDAGSEAASTWYYLWIIYNNTTLDTSSLLSLSSTSPTMPSGYDFKILVGAIYNDGSSNFLTFYQRNNRVRCNTGNTSGLTVAATASLDISAFVPLTAIWLWGNLRNSSNSARMLLSPITFTSGQGAAFCEISNSSSTVDQQFGVPIETAQTIFYAHSIGTMTIIYWGWEYDI